MDSTFMGRSSTDHSEEFQMQAFSGYRPPVELTNLGNTCSINSVVQYLLRVEPLTQYLSSDEFQHSRNPVNAKGSGCIVLDAYCNLAKEMLKARGQIAPVALKEAIGCCSELFSCHHQRDANECLLMFLDLLHEDLN
jgi:ubiquitin carboxyl-terminal hydrolase 4/11/15